jgi:periplasmic protein TonB
MKKNIFVILFLLPSFMAVGQDSTFYDYDWNKVSSINQASYYKIIFHNHGSINRATETVYFKSGQMKIQKYYSDYIGNKLDGKLKEWYENGQLQKDIDYKDGKKSGQLLTYWENGMSKRIDFFENDELIEGKCFGSDGQEIDHFDFVKSPEFPGGKEAYARYLIRQTKYPSKARKMGIEGRVVVRYTITEYGTISDIEIIQSVTDELDKEAIRVVKNMPKWEPGMEEGEAVRVTLSIPIWFRLY